MKTGQCKKHDECSNDFQDYVLGCYYDPFWPHLLMGDLFKFNAGEISVGGCVKKCGEAGFMLAGLRWENLKKTELIILKSYEISYKGEIFATGRSVKFLPAV